MAKKEVIILDSDSDDDEDTRRAIELSLQDPSMMNEEAIHTAKSTESSAAVDHTTFGGISLNRKEMEEARLHRLGKRRRNSNESGAGEPAMKRPTPQRSEQGSLQARYPQGIVRRTWTHGYARTSDDITIEEILQKEHLQLALLSSFQWDEEWLLSKLNVSKTRVLLVAFAASEEQMVFVIDLPRMEANGTRGTTVFARNMAYFLKASGVDDPMVNSLGNYDFSATENLGFVCSISGGHTGDALRRVGYCGLGATVRSLGLATDTPVEVDLACASLGSLNCDLINAIYNACQGKPSPPTLVRSVGYCVLADAAVGADLIGQSTAAGWAYIGSANLSESAWGRVVKDKVQGSPGSNGDDLAVFSGTVPVPMKVPGRPYEKTEEPWFFLGSQ
ncbi:hypothetical protein LLEC1_00249 [Akanthomyces lecanii]|uniref:PLD phosphodiesterase domain-containing protein n=1 Tax=Cordyceps confragosa TaxID=2714763 RepID=A0A179I2H5_CORDF|nr:hypothetical protein LLEC1_00249 [Akanthomyces lecanii]